MVLRELLHFRSFQGLGAKMAETERKSLGERSCRDPGLEYGVTKSRGTLLAQETYKW